MRLVFQITLAEAEDLEALAVAWGVPRGTAAWALLADSLARLRGRAAGLGSAGYAIAAAERVLRFDKPRAGRAGWVPGLEPEPDATDRG